VDGRREQWRSFAMSGTVKNGPAIKLLTDLSAGS
jgi:hypothetical protein